MRGTTPRPSRPRLTWRRFCVLAGCNNSWAPEPTTRTQPGRSVGAEVVRYGTFIGAGFLGRWLGRVYGRIVGDEIEVAAEGLTAVGTVPTLSGSTVHELAADAFRNVARSGGTQAEKAALFERLIPQIAQAGEFTATRSIATDGSVVFMGSRAEALVIDPAGQVFRGSWGTGVAPGERGLLTPVFESLRLIK